MDYPNMEYLKIAFLGEDIDSEENIVFIEEKLKNYINKFIAEKENIIFFVTDISSFDRFAKKTVVAENAKHNKGRRFVYTMPPLTNDICDELNCYIKMANRADLIICYNKGKMTQIINYAKEQSKEVIEPT